MSNPGKDLMLRALELVQNQLETIPCNITPITHDLNIETLQRDYNYLDEDDIYYPFRPDSIAEKIRTALGIDIDIPIVNDNMITLGSGKPAYNYDIDGYTYDTMENYNNYVTNVILQGERYEHD